MMSALRVDYDLIGSPMLINGYLRNAAISSTAFGKRAASGSPPAAALAATAATSNRDEAVATASAAIASSTSPLAGERGLTRTATTLLDLTLTQDELRRLDEARRAQQRSLLEVAARQKSGELRQRQPLPEVKAIAALPTVSDGSAQRRSSQNGEGGKRSADEAERSDSPPFVRVVDSSAEEDEPAYDGSGSGDGRKAYHGATLAVTASTALRSNKSEACLTGISSPAVSGRSNALLTRSYSTSWGAADVGGGGGGGLGVRFGDGAALQNLYPSLSHVRLPGGKVERIDLYFARVLKDGLLFRDVATAKFDEYEAWARTSPPRPPAALAKDLPRERMESKSIGPAAAAAAEGGARGAPPPLGQLSAALGGRGRYWSSSAGDLLPGKTRVYGLLARKLGYVDEQGRSVAAGRRRQNAAAATDRERLVADSYIADGISADVGGGDGGGEYEPVGSDDEEYSERPGRTETDVKGGAPPVAATVLVQSIFDGNLYTEEERDLPRSRRSGSDGRDIDSGGGEGGTAAGAGAVRQLLPRRAEREKSRTGDVRTDAPYRLAVVTLREMSSGAAQSTAASGRRTATAATASMAATSKRQSRATQPSGGTSPTDAHAQSADSKSARPQGDAAAAGEVGRLQMTTTERLSVDTAAAAVAPSLGRRVVHSLSLPRLSEATATMAAKKHSSGREEGAAAADGDDGSGGVTEKHFGRFSNPVCLCPKLSKETLSCMSSLRPFASAGLLANGHLFKCQLHARYV